MTEEGKITMTEFKTVVERFEENQKKIVEVVNHRFDRVEADIQILKHEVALLHEGQTEIKAQFAEMRVEQGTIKGQVVALQKGQELLLKGQSEIKAELRHKADTKDLAKLDKRVTRLENKVA